MAAISIDPLDRATALAHHLGAGFPILADPERTAIRAYGVEDERTGLAWPAVFVVDRGGRIAWRAINEQTYWKRPANDVLLDVLDHVQR